MPDFVDIGNYDFLNQSSALRRMRIKREFFDPTNKEHLASLKHYMETGNWLQQFYPEAPFTDVPMTVFRKFAGMHLDVLVTEAQRDAKTASAMVQILNAKLADEDTPRQPDIHESSQERFS